MTESLQQSPGNDDEFAQWIYQKIFDLELAQALVDAGWVDSLDEIYQVPLPGELDVYEKRVAALRKKDEELRAQNRDDCHY